MSNPFAYPGEECIVALDEHGQPVMFVYKGRIEYTHKEDAPLHAKATPRGTWFVPLSTYVPGEEQYTTVDVHLN